MPTASRACAKLQNLPWKATDDERAVVCALCRATYFALDDLTFTVSHLVPHRNRRRIWRILRAEGLSRPSPLPSARPKRGEGEFRDDESRLQSDRYQAPAEGAD
jgi:hypothetical protein